jgi:hypothetical protein
MIDFRLRNKITSLEAVTTGLFDLNLGSGGGGGAVGWGGEKYSRRRQDSFETSTKTATVQRV